MCEKISAQVDKLERVLLNELILECLTTRVSKESFIKKQLYESAGEMRDKERILMIQICELLPEDPYYGSIDNYEESSSHRVRQLIIENRLSEIFGYKIENGREISTIDSLTLLRDFKLRLILWYDRRAYKTNMWIFAGWLQ